MNLLYLEFQKTKRRGIWLVLAVLLAVLILWMADNVNDEKYSSFGWMAMLYNAPLLNAILIPTGIAIFASRIIDMEHKGSTWKLLETLQSKFQIYIAKIIYGFAGILIFSSCETAALLLIGNRLGFAGKPDAWAYGLFFIQTLIITFNLFLLQLNISIAIPNQAAALCIGLCGSMAGLFLMFMPSWPLLRNLIPWGHYGAAMFVGMIWENKEVLGYYYFNQGNGSVFFVTGWLVFLSAGGWLLFKNMDTDHDGLRKPGTGKPSPAADAALAAPGKAVVIPRQPAELIKIRRTPIWLAFAILPLISALIGTFNYLHNIEILQSTWFSLWTQHTLFFCYFFMPPLVGVYASYLWRLEHNGTNWNMVMTMVSPLRLVLGKLCMCAAMAFFTLAWIMVLFIACGFAAGITDPIPYRELADWLIYGLIGGFSICAAQCFLSLVIRSFAIPIGISLVGSMGGLFMTAKGYYYCLPYSLLSIGMRANNPNREIDRIEFLSASAFFILFFVALSIRRLKHSDTETSRE